jgi:hypothetical protein
MEVAEEEGALGIVIGARAATLMRQLRIGTVASALLHSSTVPVFLAPHGRSDIGPISRVTALYGARPGASSLIGAAVEIGYGLGVDLRLLSLIENDGLYDDEVAELTEFAEQYGGAVLAEHGLGDAGLWARRWSDRRPEPISRRPPRASTGSRAISRSSARAAWAAEARSPSVREPDDCCVSCRCRWSSCPRRAVSTSPAPALSAPKP